MRRLLFAALAVCLFATQALAILPGMMPGVSAGKGPVAVYYAACQEDTTAQTTYNVTLTPSGLSDATRVMVIFAISSLDTDDNYQVLSATADGNAMAQAAQADTTASQLSAALFYTTAEITGAASISASVTWSEEVDDLIICGWAVENLNSLTPLSSNSAASNTAASMTLDLSTTAAGGWAFGACARQTGGGGFSWSGLTSREEFDGTVLSELNVADAATTGTSLAVNCTTSSGTADSASVSAAWR